MKIRVLVIHDAPNGRRAVLKALESAADISAASSAMGSEMLPYLIGQYKPHVILRIETPPTPEEKKLFEKDPKDPLILSLLPVDAAELTADKKLSSIIALLLRKIGNNRFLEKQAKNTSANPRSASCVSVSRPLRTLPTQSSPIALPKSEAISSENDGSSRTATAIDEADKSCHRRHFNKIVFCGASTGGTEALKAFLSNFPVDSPSILITQHMPEGFTRSFADRLNKTCAIEVMEAVDRDPIRPGCAYIAPGHSHLYIERIGSTLYTRLSQDPPVNRHRPSVEVLFLSAAKVVGKQAVGVMFTGMGKDGALAMLKMREAGAYNIAQDEATSTVYGMPREAAFVGAVQEILPLSQIAHRVYEIVSK